MVNRPAFGVFPGDYLPAKVAAIVEKVCMEIFFLNSFFTMVSFTYGSDKLQSLDLEFCKIPDNMFVPRNT